MKKVLAVLLALIMVLSLAACGGNKEPEKKPDDPAPVDPVPEKKVLTVGTSPDFPPFENLEGDKVVGIEIDILNKICEKLGMTLELKQMDFDSVLPGVQAGKFLLGASGITVTESRAKNALFTVPYCMAAQAIVVVEGSPIKAKADLDGKKVSVQTGTTAEEFTMANGYDVKAFAANSDAEQAMVSGKVDAWVIDDLTAAEMVKAYNKNAKEGKKLVILDEAMTLEPYAFAAAFGSEELINSINGVLKEMLADGTIANLFKSYDAPYVAPAN